MALPPKLSRRDWPLTLVPAALWILAVYSRAGVIHLRCATDPESCRPHQVLAIDQLMFDVNHPLADGWSFTTQNWVAITALFLTLISGYFFSKRGKLTFRGLLGTWGVDLTLLLQTIAWNGMLTEFLRISVQRPRPFVYADPVRLGEMPAHYTSFVSGHTSFAAAISTAVVINLSARAIPRPWMILCGMLVGTLTLLTGLFRVMAERHFLTDVLGGAVIGILAAFWVAKIHRRKSPHEYLQR